MSPISTGRSLHMFLLETSNVLLTIAQAMARDKTSALKLPARSSGLWICFSILLSFLFWSFHDAHSSTSQSTQQYAETSDLVEIIDTPTNAGLVRRDDFTCSSDNPCRNGACCGKSGYCGYGPAYCGDGCVSNCGAVAECGQFAEDPGKPCPLNTCCSEFGFVSTRSGDETSNITPA